MGSGKNKGMITVEASLVVPMFVLFMLALSNLLMLLFAEAHIHQSLAEAAGYVAQNSYPEYKKGTGTVVSNALINIQFQKYLDEDFYVQKTIKNGKKGIVITVTDDKENPKIFYAKAVYLAGVEVPFFGKFYIFLTDRIKQKKFVGYGLEEKNDAYVYVTPNQSVYHVSRSCTHLSLQYGSLSSKNKENYTPCHFCGGGADTGKIYVSRTTNIFHYKESCSGLKRTVTRIKKAEAAGLSPCLRCGNR